MARTFSSLIVGAGKYQSTASLCRATGDHAEIAGVILFEEPINGARVRYAFIDERDRQGYITCIGLSLH